MCRIEANSRWVVSDVMLLELPQCLYTPTNFDINWHSDPKMNTKSSHAAVFVFRLHPMQLPVADLSKVFGNPSSEIH